MGKKNKPTTNEQKTPSMPAEKRKRPTELAPSVEKTKTKKKRKSLASVDAAAPAALPKEYKGFIPLAHRLSDEKEPSEDGESSPARYVYFKPHITTEAQKNPDEDEEEELPAGRTLFVVNIPYFFDFSDVSALFSCFGDVQSVIFKTPLPPPPEVPVDPTAHVAPHQAHVVFADEDGMKRAVTTGSGAAFQKTVQPYIAGNVPSGVEKWTAEYMAQRPDAAKLKQQVDRFMEAFDERLARERKAAAEEPEVDEDGFTKVTYQKGGKGRAKLYKDPDEEERQRKEQDRKQRKKARKAALVDFYRFQQRAKKQEELAVLRQKFEEDKKRINEMKAQRMFKPF